LTVTDTDVQNDIHTALDYNMNTKMEVAEQAIEYFTSYSLNGSNPGAYPNCISRSDMDASRAYVDSSGEADANGSFSRYSNMRVPAYHLTGWWDIFIDGQIETFNHMASNIEDSLAKLQKLVIGPWAHQTISSLSTGDMNYKDNAAEITKFDIEDIESVSLSSVMESELIQWYRYTLNNNSYKKIGDPTYIFPENKDWDEINQYCTVRIPAEDFEMSFTDMLNFLNGSKSLKNMKGQVRCDNPLTNHYDSVSFSFDVPAFGVPLIEGMESSPVDPIPLPDFANDVPNVRFYVIGPVNDGVAENAKLSNYWFHSDTFPIVDDIHWENFYLHKNGNINDKTPSNDEGFIAYVHDPDDPIMTVGGANMITAVPNSNKKSQGQINLADSNYRSYTMDRPGVIQFETGLIEDSLCIIGMPRMTLYAKSNPSGNINGLTDTDFFIRVLDVYPDGREYFVVEGAVNARAREYARSLANDAEDDDAIYSNINSGQVYEYYFKLLPIAYTWGKNHKMKILISSSNHTRYQVNANIPVDDGGFYLRTPMDGRSFTYQGQTVLPRKAVQRIAFSPDYPTNISLPIFQPGWSALEFVESEVSQNDFLMFPNPANEYVSIITGSSQKSFVRVFDMLGKEIFSDVFIDEIRIDNRHLLKGVYVVEVITESISISKRLIIK
jgi:predicted acyl esterase